MSPLPGAFAGRSPQPAMEAGGAGKPVGQEEELPTAPQQWLTGAYGGDGGLERSAAARVESEGGRRVRNFFASSEAACMSSTIDDRRGPNSTSRLMGHSSNCRLIGSGMPGVCCSHRFLCMRCCHAAVRAAATAPVEQRQRMTPAVFATCLFGQTMRVSRHGGDVMRQQGDVIHNSLLLHHAPMRSVCKLGRQLVFGSGRRYRPVIPVCQTLRLRDLDKCFHQGTEPPGLCRSPTEVRADGGKHRPDRVETGGACRGLEPPDATELVRALGVLRPRFAAAPAIMPGSSATKAPTTGSESPQLGFLGLPSPYQVPPNLPHEHAASAGRTLPIGLIRHTCRPSAITWIAMKLQG
ncbi:unnamed protein product [Boreogadus saida]